ncbi:MAG: hypothetical protein GY811_09780 [Myxococcales bacterium]|nr:hypothetical protein [Myxococcales bacterium]
MTSHLSSLLVRDGLVRVHRMEHVFQRQVIHGGCLDTILLEMELVDDHRLQQYLSLATGLPPQNHGETKDDVEALRKICNEDMAKKYAVVPAKLDGNSLSVLVCDPVLVDKLEGLADELDMSVQPMVVPEYQFRMSLAELFGGEADKRFSQLAAKRSTKPLTAAERQVPTVTIGDSVAAEEDIDAVDDAAAQVSNTDLPPSASDTFLDAVPTAIEPEATQPADTSERVRGTRAPAEQPKRRHTMELNTDALREHVKATHELAANAPKIGVAKTEALEAKADETKADEAKADEAKADEAKAGETKAEAAAKPDSAPQPADESRGEAASEVVETPAAAPDIAAAAEPEPSIAKGAPPETETNPTETDPYASVTPDEARHLLSATNDRDEIFVILLRAIRKRARHASLFTLKGQSATGRVALSKAGIDNDNIRQISIPLNVPSRFQQVFQSKAFSVGDLGTDDATLREALASLGGGEIPKSALLLPVVMRDRLIAIAVGHNRDKGISVGRVIELLPLGTATADAVSRILAQMRAAKNQPGPTAAASSDPRKTEVMAVSPVHIDSETDKTIKTEAVTESSATLPVADEAMLDLFSRIESGKAKVVRKATAEAMNKLDEVVEHLQFGFPGKLTHPREENAERMRAADHGPILDLVTQIGPKCGPALAEKMRDADREVRYYATLCGAELRPADVLNQLVERLFDGDESIRALAVEALEGYPSKELHAALDFARKALHSEDNPRVKVAADGLTKLADTTAIPDLIDAHSRGGDAAEVSRRALFQLTNQDFGNSNRKWRSWWESNQGRHRIEWMLDGLSHKNAEIRKNASETLRSLTGEFFGYGHDLPKKERDKTRKLWEQWWKATGNERFTQDSA